MQDDLYPPGMAPKSGKPAAPRPPAKPQPRSVKPASSKPASILPPAATEPTHRPEEPDTEIGELLPESAALPPEAESPQHLPSPITITAPAQLKVSTAPSAARVSKKRDRQATRFLVLTVLGSIAIVTLFGVGFFLINP